MTSSQPDVVLVRMPFSEISQPSLALGLLSESCNRAGLDTRVLPANIWFAEEFGLALHNLIFEAYSTTLLGEWVFSQVLFPDFEPDDDEYLKKCLRLLRLDNTVYWQRLLGTYPYLDPLQLLRTLRAEAPAFVSGIAKKILEHRPKIVGCTSMFQQQCASLALLRTIKELDPEVVTMLGGANCEGDMGRAAFELFPFVDYVVSGDADGFFGGLCLEALSHGSGAPSPISETDGVYGPEDRSPGKLTPLPVLPSAGKDLAPIVRLDDMDQSPVPNYDDYFAGLKESPLGEFLRPALPFQTARGCWWGEKSHCSFCGISKTAMKFRSKSAGNVMEQMYALRDKYGINTFQGTEYIFDWKYFDTLLPELKKLNSRFRFEVKANLKDEHIHSLIESGVLEVQPGIESMHDDILGLLRKGTTALRNVSLLKRAREVGLSVYWNLLHTIPGDQDAWYDEMADLFPLLHHLQPPVATAAVHYDRFSPYWRNPEEYGLTLLPAFGYEMVYPFERSVLNRIAYFFQTPEQREHFLVFDKERHAGVLRLHQEILAWRAAFWGATDGGRPTLEAKATAEGLEFRDTRAGSPESSFVLDGLDRALYEAIGDGISRKRLLANLGEAGPEGPSEEELEDALGRLFDRRVVVQLSGRLFGLALTDPPALLVSEGALAEAEDVALHPQIAMMRADKALDQMRPNLATKCSKRPEDQSLQSWIGGLTR